MKSPLPELLTRIKIDLRRLFVTVIDHSTDPEHQLLFFKERFHAKDHPERPKMDRFSAKLRKLGHREEAIGLGPTNEPISCPNKADPSSIRHLASPWASARHLGMSQWQHPQTQAIVVFVHSCGATTLMS